MWNHPKTHHMIAYGVITWPNLNTSPVHDRKIPAITKIFTLRGYISDADVLKMIDRLEEIMIDSGYLTFGVALKDENRDQISLLSSYGYETELFGPDKTITYLLKKRELLK
jgi:hypothetical protein